MLRTLKKVWPESGSSVLAARNSLKRKNFQASMSRYRA